MEEFAIKPIAHIESDFTEKFGIPRQAGIVEELEAKIVFEPEYRVRDALRGLEDFSHIWLIWQFSEAVRQDWSPTVRPPRLGGNTRMGVFATRSPFRPNNLGLSCVKLMGIEDTKDKGTVLKVAGADLMNGTPIFDIKPYIPYADSKPEALGGFAPDSGATLQVEMGEEALGKFPVEKREALRAVLANDPRPRYQNDPDRIYSMDFAGFDVKFSVDGEILKLISTKKK